MKPITFSCTATPGLPSEDIARQTLDVSRRRASKGFAVIPGIKGAKFEVRTPGVVGSRVRVTNQDGSSHVGEVVEWEPRGRVTLHLKEFSAPPARLPPAKNS